jgi:acetyltransferase
MKLSLDPLFRPASVAVVGASATPGKMGHAVAANLVAGGYAGDLVLVNRRGATVLGRPTLPRLADRGAGVDLCVIALPAARTEAAVAEAVAAGARAIVVLSAGFKEYSDEGAAWEAAIARRCADRGVILLGPKSLGVINPRHRLNASFTRHLPKAGGLSVLTVSGALGTAILDGAAARHLGVASFACLGNQAGLTEIDLLHHFSADPETRLVAGYLESITSGEAFVKAAGALSAVKPVILFRAGTTSAGARAAAAHTGSRPGGDVATVAAFKRAGVVRADGVEALCDAAAALSLQPLPRGDRVAVVTNGGGPGVVAADALERAGLHLATLSAETTRRLVETLPSPSSARNPIDLLGDADPDRYARAADLALADEGVDALLLALTPHATTRPGETAGAVARGTSGDKPVLVVMYGSSATTAGRQLMAASGLPSFGSPERAVAALKAMREHAVWRGRPVRVLTRFPVNRRRVERLLRREVRMGRNDVGEVRAKEILQAYEFNVLPGQLVLHPDEAVAAADLLGYPVALKIVSPDVLHKSDVGGVKLSLSSPDEVRDAFDLITLRLQRTAPGARMEGIYVEKMCARGLEVALGMQRDPQFGPVLLFGLGGLVVEALSDKAYHLAPITAEEATAMLEDTRSYRLLRRTRGQPQLDLPALARGLQRLSQLVTDLPAIEAIELNPFTLTPASREPVVVDAQMTLSAPRAEA